MKREEKEAVLREAAGYINSLLPLAVRIESDEFTKTDREKLRKLTNTVKVFQLSNVLNHLCGETARLHQRGDPTTIARLEKIAAQTIRRCSPIIKQVLAQTHNQ